MSVTGSGSAYTLVDIDGMELAKAPDDVLKVDVDITSSVLSRSFDVIISMHLVEHVRNPKAMHRNARAMLQPGGVAIHFFPTLYTTPFMVNRVIPEKLAERVLLRLQPYRVSDGNRGTFPAYYRWCRGPTRGQVRRMLSTGFEVDEYVAGFGHAYYCRTPVLQHLEDAKTRFLKRHPVAVLTSYAIMVLRRPL